MSLRVYVYEKCDTCRKALKFLADRHLVAEILPIRQQPPTLVELRKMLGARNGEMRRLFNTSGLDYKALKMKDKLPGLSEAEALALLSANGNLVKRPFLLTAEGGLVGFKPEEWERFFGNRAATRGI